MLSATHEIILDRFLNSGNIFYNEVRPISIQQTLETIEVFQTQCPNRTQVRSCANWKTQSKVLFLKIVDIVSDTSDIYIFFL